MYLVDIGEGQPREEPAEARVAAHRPRPDARRPRKQNARIRG